LSDINKYNVYTVGAPSDGTKNIRGGISGVAAGSESNSIIVSTPPIAVGNIGDYLSKLYGQSTRSFWSPFVTKTVSYTMYPLSTITIGALYGRSKAGCFL
jgi:hypothetical protein